MIPRNVSSAKLRCPRCRGEQFIQHQASDRLPPRDGITCKGCGTHLSPREISAEIEKMNTRFRQAMANHIRKSLK
jgi:ribosomal protein S27E